MGIVKVEITYRDGHKKVYKVGDAFEMDCDSVTYLTMTSLKEGNFGEYGFIPLDVIESWKVVD